jgi:hypothetical protein
MPRTTRRTQSSFEPLDDANARPPRREASPRHGLGRNRKARVADMLRDLAEDVTPEAWAKIERILQEVEK